MGMNWDTSEETNSESKCGDDGLSLSQFEEFHSECKKQPQWRSEADRQSDYLDGLQLDSDILKKQQMIGMPPAIDPLMGAELDHICGLEARLRKNWRVIPNSDVEDDDIAEAMSAKLNAAERHSKADKACSDAFRGQAGVGTGWVEVSRDPNPFNFPYRAVFVPRNEIWWDWKGSLDPAGLDHRYRIRRRWTDKEQAKLFFPDKADLIEQAATGWSNMESFTLDGGRSTGLSMTGGSIVMSGSGAPTLLQGETPGTYAMLSTAYATEQQRGSSIEEQEWRDTSEKRICLFECWYRVWSKALVFKMDGGRTVEYDPTNMMHLSALASGQVEVLHSVISKVRLAIWLGPHKLSDEPSPYKHNKFPYVPFWGKREDRTHVPYGLARAWMYPQDAVNAIASKLRWGISAVRVERTEGAYAGTDEQLHREAARLDADIVLDAKKMAEPGAKFEIKRDFQLTDQQAALLKDSRDSIRRTGMGLDDGNQTNDSIQVLETIPNSHGVLFDNARESRNEVGELLLSMIIEDIGHKEHQVTIKGNVINDSRKIGLNMAVIHPVTGETYLDNDLQNTLLKVVLEDVPSTTSYRAQQLQSFSEVVKSAPENIQVALYPHMFELMDVPNKSQAVDVVRQASKQPTPEDIAQQVKDAVDSALVKANVDNKGREIELKGKLQDAQIAKLAAETLLTRVTAYFEAIQTGGALVATPAIAKVSDVILQSAGLTAATPTGINPMIEQAPLPTQGLPSEQPGVSPVEQGAGTHPNFPERPASPAIGVGRGIETPRLGD